MSVLLVLMMLSAVPTETEIKAFGSTEAESRIDEILYAAKTAEYGTYRVESMPPSTIYPSNRYKVVGYVDSQNKLGVHLRADWDAVVHITPKDKLVLLGLSYTSLEGKTSLLYEADVEAWCRPEIYAAINKEYLEAKDKIVAQIKRLPQRSRQKHLDKKVDEYLASVRKKFGLTPSQLGKILKL